MTANLSNYPAGVTEATISALYPSVTDYSEVGSDVFKELAAHVAATMLLDGVAEDDDHLINEAYYEALKTVYLEEWVREGVDEDLYLHLEGHDPALSLLERLTLAVEETFAGAV